MPSPLTYRQRIELRAARAMSRMSPRLQVKLSGKPPVRRDGQALAPDLQLSLALVEHRGGSPLDHASAPEIRAAMRQENHLLNGIVEPVAAVRELSIDGAAGPLRARHYTPAELGEDTRPPLLVFFHGGGFAAGDLETHDSVCRMLCRHAGVHVLSVDYRLAPEHPFPAAIEDAIASLQWAAEHAAELGADPARLAVGGDSAGGNMSAVAAWHRDAPPLALQLLFYPATDAVERYPSRDLFGEGFFLTDAHIAQFVDWYCPQAGRADPRLSILRAEDLSGLAPAIITTAGFDPLRDEGEAYAHALRAAGNTVVLRRFDGLIHGFANMSGISPPSRDALVEIAGIARGMLAVGPEADPGTPADASGEIRSGAR